MLGMIIIQALEDPGEVHTGNELQYMKNSSSQTFLSSHIFTCLILSIKKRRIWNIGDSYKTIFEQKI